jgi:hypothetical protein
MKKILVLTAGLILVVGLASANSITLNCGSVDSADGSSTFVSGTASSGLGGTATISGSVATITCNAFAVPVGYTLTDIELTSKDDGQFPADANSALTWSWANTSGALTVPALTATTNEELAILGGFSFGSCNSASGSLPCDATETYDITVLGGGSTTPYVFTVSSAPGGAGSDGTGVGASGNTSAGLAITFDYTANSTGTPEPMSMMLVGGGLLGLGLVASKLRKKA